ncbi:MAG: PRC-barrel domain-containing protein [Anaerolineales bacterium]|nr:PRC-barrel domain-containing protein [Anaerolineales bacterium]
MRLGKDLTGKPIISVTDGRFIGNVKDLYVNRALDWMTGIHLGHEGLLKRKYLLVPRDQVAVFGIDAILVKETDVITTLDEQADAAEWLRLEKLRGREVDTPGGTKVGTVGDVIIGSEGEITGFTLGRVFVEGPIAAHGRIPRAGLVDTGSEDGAMTVDLPKVEALLQGDDAEPSEKDVPA